MYGYTVPYGYMGMVEGRWMLFPTDMEYYEYMEELCA
jgi:hypothetical protein